MDIFEQASRKKLRFNTSRGVLTTEDLWDAPLSSRDRFNLDDIAQDVNRKLKESEQESFVLKKSKSDEDQLLRLEIAKHIIAVKLEARSARENEKKTAEKRQAILNAIAEQEAQEVRSKSVEELQKMLEDL